MSRFILWGISLFTNYFSKTFHYLRDSADVLILVTILVGRGFYRVPGVVGCTDGEKSRDVF